MPNVFAESLLAALRFAAIWTVFYLLYRPRTRFRMAAAIVVMVLQYPTSRVLFFASSGNGTVCIIWDTILFLTLAFVCETELANDTSGAPVRGDLLRPVISALHFNGMLQLVNFIMICYRIAYAGALPPPFALSSYFWRAVEGICLLFWSLFYYRIARNMTAKAPVSFSLFIVLTPIAGSAVLAAGNNAIRPLLDVGVNVFLYAGFFGTLLAVLNMCVFYFYTKLSVAHEALLFARELSPAPPVWTREQGLSSAFIEKYEITPREREVVEAMLQGKTDKEISIKLNIATNTVHVHLKRIYRKTGAAGRFALSALVRAE